MKKNNGSKREKKTPLLYDIAGWYGVVAVLSGYLLISFAVLDPFDLSYQLLNLSGSIGLGLICYYKRTYQPLFVNIVWGIIAILAVINIVFFIAS